MPDCKNPHSIFLSDPTLGSSCTFVLTTLVIFLFLLLFVFLLFVATMMQHTKLKTDFKRRFLTQISLRNCNVFTVMLSLHGLMYTDGPLNTFSTLLISNTCTAPCSECLWIKSSQHQDLCLCHGLLK